MSNTEVEDFTSSLSDLHTNSKPHINMLTMLAEENIVHAPAIVQAVEKHLNQVPSEIKLPVLYLIDSIVKNIGQDYISLFTQNIVSTFGTVFEKVDEKTRSQMFKLRQTWNDVFSAKKLYALDAQVQKIDPAWPITAQPPTIHFNPRFLHVPSPQPQIGIQEDPPNISESMMREQLLKKQKELLELQQKKLELELIATKAKLEEQQKQLERQTGNLHAEQVQQLLLPALEAAKLLTVPKEIEPPLTATLKGSSVLSNRIAIPPQANASSTGGSTIVRPRDPRLARQQPTRTPSVNPSIVAPSLPTTASSVVPVPVPVVTSSTTISQFQATPLTVVQSSKFEPVKMVDSAKSKSQISINLANKSMNKEHRGVTKKDPRLMSSNKNISNSSSTNTNSLPSTSTNNKGRLKGKESPSLPSPQSSPRKNKSSNTSSSSRNKSQKVSKVIDLTASPPPKSHTSSSNEHSNSHHNKINSPIKSDSRKKKLNSSEKKKSTKSSSDSSNNTKRSISPQSKKKRDRGRESPIIKYEVLDVDSPSPPPPPFISDKDKSKTVFKEVKVSAKGRNYMRRNNRADSASPDLTSTDVDLRVPPEKQARVDSEEIKNTGDVDLRQITASPAKKRPSLDPSEQPNKKSKSDKFDILFGNEDVDLRKLAPPPPSNKQTQSVINQQSKPPSPPPPPVISPTDGTSWAKYKEARKSEGIVDSPRKRTHSTRETFDRLGRPLLYHRLISDERRMHLEDAESGGRDDNAKMNLIMSQAEEQLASGSLSPEEYNVLIKEVIHMNEERKLREARRRESENKENWDDEFVGAPQFSPCSDSSENSHAISHQPQPPQHPPRFGDIDERFQMTSSNAPPQATTNTNVILPSVSNNGSFWEQATSRWDTPPRPWGGPIGPMPPRMVHPGPGFHRPPNDFPTGNFGPRMGRWRPGFPPQGPLGPGRMPFENDMERFDRFPGNRFVRPPQPPQPPLPPQTMVTSIPPPAHSPIPGHNISIQQSGVVSKNELPPADPKMLDIIAQDSMRTINIDGVPREIRYYGETALVMMAWDDPREIGFQDGARRVIFDDRESITCAFGESYRDIIIDGQTHRVRLGAPTRELYINGQWYECFFGGPPIKVEISGKVFVVKLEGPAPQVKIGLIRRDDLCAGKINLIIDARAMLPVFLDAKPQRFDIEGKPHVLKFADSLRTVLINGKSFKVEFGGLPKPIHVREKKHFIRFSVLPRKVTPGIVKIRDMEGSSLPSPTISQTLPPEILHEDSSDEAAIIQPPTQQGHTPAMPMIGRIQKRLQNTDEDSQPETETTTETNKTNKTGPQLPLDMLSSLIPSQMAPASAGFGYQVDPESRQIPTTSNNTETTEVSSTTNTGLSILPKNVDVGALFQRLVATGIVPINQPVANAAAIVAATAVAASVPSATKNENSPKENEDILIKNVDFSLPDTLKVRQPGIISFLYSGIQCSSCGVRFPPEQTMKYSQHLDWHFRQNRRDKDSARHAHSRKWYYDVSDWIQFEEIEDLEERAQSWFETQQAAEGKETGNEEPQAILSVSAGKSGEDSRCEMCHDRFDQFYNEESEDWHLKNAVRIEDKIFHPLCYDDFKASLQTSMESVDSEQSKPEIEDNQSKTTDMDVDQEESTTIENAEKEMDVEMTVECLSTDVEMKDATEDIKIQETEEGETKEDKLNVDSSEVTNEIVSDEILIKSEFNDSALENETSPTSPNIIEDQKDVSCQDLDETLAPPIDLLPDTTLAAVASSIDGNVQYDAEPTPTAPTTKIKINISKPLPPPSETVISGDTSESEKAENSETDETPFPPPQIKLVKEKMLGRTFTELPPVFKDRELSGLCSIM